MATKVIQQIERDLSRQLRELNQLAREIDQTQKGPPKRATQRKPAEYVTMPAKDAVALIRQEIALSAKNLGNVYGRRSGSGIYNFLVDELEKGLGKDAGLRSYIEVGAKVGVHLVAGAVQESPSAFIDNAAKLGIQAAMLAFISGVSAANGGLASAVNKLHTDAAFPSTAETDAIAVALGEPDKTPIANPFKGKAKSLLRPFNIEYLEWLDATVERKTAELGDMKKFIANSAAQRAVVMYLPRKSPKDGVLLPQVIGGTTVGAVETALGNYPSKSITETYAYYKAAYDDYMNREQNIVTGDVSALVKSAKSSLDSLPALMRKAGYSKSAIAPLASLINQISIKPDRDSIIMAGVDLAVLIDSVISTGGAFSGAFTLGSPLDSTSSNLTNAVSAELTSGSVSVGLNIDNPESLELQAALQPTSFASLEIRDPRNADMRNAVIRAWLDLTTAYDELLGVSFLPSTGLPEGVVVAPPAVSTEFKKFARDGIAEIFQNAASTAITAVGSARLSPQARGALTGAIADVANTLLDSTDLAFSDLVSSSTAKLRLAASEKFLLRLASGGQVSDAASLSRGELEAELNQLRVSPKDRRAALSIFDNVTGYMMNGINGLSVQARSIGMRLRSNPALSKLQATGVGAGSLYITHATSAVLQGALKPVAGSGTAMAADLVPSLAAGGLGAYWHLKGPEQYQASGLPTAIGAIGHLAARYIFTRPAVRFSDNAILKGLQYLVNGPAALVGDYSMGPCAALPLNLQGKSTAEAGKIIAAACRMNTPENAAVLGVQAGLHGLQLGLLEDGGLQISTTNAVNVDAINDPEVAALVMTVVGESGMTFAAASRAYQRGYTGEVFTAEGLYSPALVAFNRENTAEDGSDAQATANAVSEAIKLVPAAIKVASIASRGAAEAAEADVEVPATSGFILEPGIKADLYSAEDGYQGLTPPPAVNSDSGIAQLQAAMNRARKLTPQEITMEGYPDLVGEAVIMVDPATARAIESRGLGMSLGPSTRSNGSELVTFEVMGANTLEPVAPERQHSVPQGAIGYPKIQQANSMTVSPRGAFNRGAFDPIFG